jgi:hypothetical protein
MHSTHLIKDEEPNGIRTPNWQQTMYLLLRLPTLRL